jgi:hypothetical protein
MPKTNAEQMVVFNIRIPNTLRLAIKRIARKRSETLDRDVTAKDVVLNNLCRDEDLMKEWKRIKAGTPKAKR